MADPKFGMGLSSDDLHHINAFIQCNDVVLLTHLMVDHDVKAEALSQEPSSMLLHMTVHGHVVEIREDEEE